MSTNTGRRLGEIINALMRREKLRVTDVIVNSGIAANTLKYLRQGRTGQPDRETVYALAVGLSTHPWTQERDEAKMAEIERLLNVAAGYAEPTAAEAQTLIELGAYYRLRSLSRARYWAEQIEAEANAAGEPAPRIGRVD